jgi:putative ABC transport system ATP-binding protein
MRKSSSVPPAFELDHVSRRVGSTVVLDDVTVDLPDDGVTVIVGRSGSGKSSLLRLLNRLSVPTAGVVRFRGTDVATIDPRRLRRQVAMIFQRPTMLGDTGLDDLRVADPALDEEAAAMLCEQVHLDPPLLRRSTDALSGGEAQRLCIARALATEPAVLLADEATSSLDFEAGCGIETLARELAEGGTPVIWVTHDREQVRRTADRVVVIDAGRVVATGSVDELLRSDDRRIRNALGGS